ncbi:aspartyl-phosphate phosphatase Spo0E family protein [Sediminibacillus massiliensis]|uniref:aspartyl-phosphate phosphatase Spo0E family protein n=1 Tax=Sediminibacillus massiliensis TaxID=1926277 RepID=UPI0015C33F0A|nr:aspartyl-phosphate phosphatase Spo0E family protein [Sediminibacillus massiliensis]
MEELRLLEQKIEKIRQEMYEAYEKDPDNQEVLHISQALDKAINDLNTIKVNLKNT